MSFANTRQNQKSAKPAPTPDQLKEVFDRRSTLLRAIDGELRDVDCDIRDLKRRIDLQEQRRLWALGMVTRGDAVKTSDEFDALLAEEWYDAGLREVLKVAVGNTPWQQLTARGATDQQILAKLKAWPNYGTYSHGGGAGPLAICDSKGPRFRVADSFQDRIPPAIELTGAKLIFAVRRVMKIGAPAKPVAPAKKPPAKSPAVKAPAATSKKKPASKPARAAKSAVKPAAPQASVDDAIRRACASFSGSESRWAKLRDQGATDAELAKMIGDEFGIRGGFSSGVGYVEVKGGAGPWLQIPKRKKLSGASLVNEVRRVMGIGLPKGEATAAAQPSMKPAAKPIAGKREQTYGQWLSSLNGIKPSEAEDVDFGGADPTKQNGDLVQLFSAKKSPSESKQILIAAGWFDGVSGADLDLGSSAKLLARMNALDLSMARSPRIAKDLKDDLAKCKRRSVALARWEADAESLGIEMRGAHLSTAKPAEKSASGESPAPADADPPIRDVPGQMMIDEAVEPVAEDGYAMGFTPAKFEHVNSCGAIPAHTPLDKPKAKPATVKGVQLGDRLYVCLSSSFSGDGREGFTFTPLYTPDAFKKRFASDGFEERLGGIETHGGHAGIHVMTGRGRFVIGPRDEQRQIEFDPKKEPALATAGGGDDDTDITDDVDENDGE